MAKRDGARFGLYLTNDEKTAVVESAESLGIKPNRLIRIFVNSGLENLENDGELTGKIANIIRLMRSKEEGKKTGELVYSYDKEKKKILKIEELAKDGTISKEEAKRLKLAVKRQFKQGRKALRSIINCGTTRITNSELLKRIKEHR